MFSCCTITFLVNMKNVQAPDLDLLYLAGGNSTYLSSQLDLQGEKKIETKGKEVDLFSVQLATASGSPSLLLQRVSYVLRRLCGLVAALVLQKCECR
jgi:hypothetical protein